MKLNDLQNLSILIAAEAEAEAKAQAAKEAEAKKSSQMDAMWEARAQKAAADRKAQMRMAWYLHN